MLTENGSGMVMPVGPMYGNGGSGAFGGWNDGSFSWTRSSTSDREQGNC